MNWALARHYVTPLLAALALTAAAWLASLPHARLESVILIVLAWVWTMRLVLHLKTQDTFLSESIVQLENTVDRWASGDLEARVYLDQADALDRLAHGMNRVAEALKERTEDLEQDKERLEAILTSMANGIIILSHGLTVTLINQAAYQLFGIESKDVLGSHLLEVIRDVAIDDAVHQVTTSGITETVLWSPHDAEDEVIEVTVAALNQPLGGVGAVLVARNVSAQKQVERMRQDFVANVSHELQTPLTIIRGFTETLQDDTDPDTARRFIQLIHEEATRMSHLVDDLLALSRMEHHSLPVNRIPVDVPVLVESIVVKLGPRAEASELIFDNQLPSHIPMVAGDPDLLAEVFLNLISNAVQYTPAGGLITIKLASLPGDSMVGIAVKDTGIGIPSQDISRIFERFYRVDRARSRASGGTGLGLAIVKHIMELHQGRIEVSSQVGQGTTFTVWLHRFSE